MLIINIDDASIDHLVDHTKKLMRLYGILLVIAIVTTAISATILQSSEALAVDLVSMVLYCTGILFLYRLCFVEVNSLNATLPIINALLLLLVETADMIFILTVFRVWTALIDLIFIFSQILTLIILFKLREKIVVSEGTLLAGAPPSPVDDNV